MIHIRTEPSMGAGFLQRIACPDCGTKMSPANLGKHRPACAETAKYARYFAVRPTPRQLKSVRRNLELYGMTLADYAFLFDSQNGKCAICGNAEMARNRPSVDHCHRSGRVRSLLCDACNKLIGIAKENGDRLRAAATYVDMQRAIAIESNEVDPYKD